ncbi:hypothetical protein IQ06DRAFT_215784 [Phaeosphaeriaceae sp. SRC1lsM3a]|nr:hypothetical protein IQ06DRAFT_215784 [Stagonospora sp. SRC1lsM3a]
MCRVEERIYISAEGHRSKFEDSFPCDKARNGKLCSKVKRKTTEYFPKRGIVPRNDTPSPINPPTPTGTGTYLVQQRRPSSSGGRPSTRDGQKTIIIDFGPKGNKSKKYTSGSSKRSSIGATYDDVAVESPGSDASHTIRTGLPEAPLPPQAAYGHSDAYSTTPTVSHGYHHRHTSSTSSYTGSSRTPSLYVTSDADYDSPTNTRGTRLPPAIHNPPTVGAPSSPGRSRTHGGTTSATYNLTVVSPGYAKEPPLPDNLSALDYHDFADRSGSSHASSASASKIRRGKDSDQPRKNKDEERRRQESDREAENIKQVRFELGRAESRAKERNETLLAEKEKQRAADRDEIHRRKEKERKEREPAAKSRKKERLPPVISNSSFKRPAGSRRGSMTMTPAQQDEQRRLLAAELGQMQGESRATEAREREERAAFLQQQQQDPSYYNPRTGGTSSNTTLTRRDSQSRRESISSDARPIMLGRSNSRRTSISQPNPPAINTKVAQGLTQPSARTHAPPPLSFPSNFNTRPTSARRSSFSSQDLPFATSARSSAANLDNPFATAATSGLPVNPDPWDARNLREALPTPTSRQPSDGRYTIQRRGEDVIKASGTHSAAREATRAMGRVAGYEGDYVTDSEDEITHGHGRRRY